MVRLEETNDLSYRRGELVLRVQDSHHTWKKTGRSRERNDEGIILLSSKKNMTMAEKEITQKNDTIIN